MMNFFKNLLSGLTILLLSFSLNAAPSITPTKTEGVKEEIESLHKKPNFCRFPAVYLISNLPISIIPFNI